MSLEEDIFKDYKEALKNKDSFSANFLSYLRAELKNYAISKKVKNLDDNDVIVVLKKKLKQANESLQEFKKAQRNELITASTKEIALLKKYLPALLPKEEVVKKVKEIIAKSGASSLKDMGRVMKEAISLLGPAVDAKQLSNIVKELLS